MNDLKPGWKRVKFGEVVRQVKDKVEPATSGLERFVAGEHMDTDELRIRRWGDVGDGYLGPAFHMRFKPGHVLYGSRRTYLRKVAVADFLGICANTTFVLETARPNELLPEFLPFIMITESFHEHSKRESKGSVNPYVNFSDLAWYEFVLPPLEEQRRIVTLLRPSLNVVESHAELLNIALESLSALRTYYFDTIAGPELLLDALCQKDGIQIGPFGAQLHQADYADDGIPVVMPCNMENDSVNHKAIARVRFDVAAKLGRHHLNVGDILLPRRGELDRRAIVRTDENGWLCGTGSVRIRVRPDVSAQLVLEALALRSTVRWLNANAVGTTMKNLNTRIVQSIPIRMPPASKLEEAVFAFDEVRRAISVSRLRAARAKACHLHRLALATSP